MNTEIIIKVLVQVDTSEELQERAEEIALNVGHYAADLTGKICNFIKLVDTKFEIPTTS